MLMLKPSFCLPRSAGFFFFRLLDCSSAAIFPAPRFFLPSAAASCQHGGGTAS